MAAMTKETLQAVAAFLATCCAVIALIAVVVL